MKILVELGHPAHVHYFRTMIKILMEDDHELLVLARKKEITFELLNAYEIDYVPCGENRNGMLGKALNLVSLDMKIFKHARSFKPDIFLSPAILYNAHVGRLLGKSVIGFSDTEHATLNLKLFLPFADAILTPSCFLKELGPKQFRFNGYLELMYLHPNRFKPDPGILQELGLGKEDKYAIMRFVSWNASHDMGQTGLSLEQKTTLVKEIEKHAVPIITSEGELPKSLQKYKLRIPPHRIHHALYYASLYMGEGATMASEASVLGTPSAYINTLRMGYTNEEEKYGLIKQYDGTNNSDTIIINDIAEMINTPKENWIRKKEKLLEQKIDVTAFMVWFIENYPESARIMRENPEFQNKFIYSN